MNKPPLSTADLQGLWRRSWIRSANHCDETTRVFWAQAGNQFVDIRIPANRPDIVNYSCLAELDAPSLTLLSNAEGFAGNIELRNNTCTWHRAINWHGQTDSIDAGELWFSRANTTLIEQGIHHDYQEEWKRVPGHVFNKKLIEHRDMTGWLLYSDTLFIFGIGDKSADSAVDIRQSLQQGVIPVDVQRLFSSQYCMGKWKGQHGSVELSTNPFYEGKPVLTREDGCIRWLHLDYDGTESVVLL